MRAPLQVQKFQLYIQQRTLKTPISIPKIPSTLPPPKETGQRNVLGDGGPSVGAVVGIVVAIVFVLALAAAVFFW